MPDPGLDAVPISNQQETNAANMVADQPLTALLTKMASAKGSKMALPQFTGDTSIDSSILDKMEKLAEQKRIDQSSLVNTLQDVLAIFPGDPTLRSQSIATRANQRAQEEADVFNLEQTAAAGRSAIANQQKALADIYAVTRGTGAGGAGGGAYAPGGMFGLDPNVLARVDRLASSGQTKMAMEMLNQHMKDVGKTGAEARGRLDFYKNEIAVPDPSAPGGVRYMSMADLATEKGLVPTPEGAETVFSKRRSDEAAARAAGIPVISGDRSYEKQYELWSKSQEPGYKGPPVAKPGKSLHQYGLALDVQRDKLTPENIQWLENRGYKFDRIKNDPNHVEKVIPVGSTMAPTAAPTTRGLTAEQRMYPETQKEAINLSSKQYYEGPYKELNDIVSKQRNTNISNDIDMALKAVDRNDFGPGTSLGQAFKKYAATAGIDMGPKGLQKFMDTAKIEQVRDMLAYSGMRAALGSQFTATENEQFKQLFAGIDSPKEFLKRSLEVEKAKVLMNEDKHRFISDYARQNPGKEKLADDAWETSGARQRILKDTVTGWGSLPTPEEKKPAKSAETKTTKTIPFGDLNKKKEK